MINSTALKLFAASAGLGFIAYCVYFDRKRRSAPDFKQKLRERRRKAKEKKQRASRVKFPDLRDNEATQKFFMEHLQIGETLLNQGLIDQGLDHMSNAVVVCSAPEQLMALLSETMPPSAYLKLREKLPAARQALTESQCADLRQMPMFPSAGSMYGAGVGGPQPQTATVTDITDDLE